MVIRTRSVLPLAATLAACNVSSSAPPTTGGTPERGAVVLLTDYTSTQIALTGLDGTTLSPAFLSTASTKASGLAFALSGDVVVPSSAPRSELVVLLDRYGTNVITWANPTSAKVLAQLPVGTGFESNPQDYVEIDATHAYVSRWGVNAAPGAQKFDSGSDVLLIDTKTPAITASIPMPKTNGLPPRPSGMVQIGETTTLVVLQNESEDFKTMGDSVLVGIANGAVAWQEAVSGLKGCGRPALSPLGHTLALSCEGALDANGNVIDVAASAVALFDVTSMPPKAGKRFAIADQLGSPTQDRVAFATETLLLGKTQTPLGGTTNNQAFSLDTTSGKATVLLTAGTDAQGKGKGIVYGGVHCGASVCLLADADVGKLQRWSIAGGALKAMAPLVVETTVGLPPVDVGAY